VSYAYNRDAVFHWRGAISFVTVYYISVPLQIFKVELEVRETGITKEVTLGLSVFVVGFSWVGNIVNTLGSEISPLEESKSFLLCFLLGFIESVGDMKMGRN